MDLKATVTQKSTPKLLLNVRLIMGQLLETKSICNKLTINLIRSIVS